MISKRAHEGQTLQEWAGTSRIFALVFTDIVDSTKLANELGDERWIDLFLKHCARARELMPKYNGHEIKTIGDSFMVIFRTALDAMDFLLALVSNTGDERLSIRAGIHVGSARIMEMISSGTWSITQSELKGPTADLLL